jgi:hypothetical protein
MTNIAGEETNLTVAKFILLVLALLVVITVSYVLYTNYHADREATTPASNVPTSSSSSSSNPYVVLSPATVAPKVAECSQPLTYYTNGTSGPIQCSNGDLNVSEWDSLSALELKVMTLGYGASESQVESTICSDLNTNAGTLIEQTAYQISALYYGWSYGSAPTAEISNGSC